MQNDHPRTDNIRLEPHQHQEDRLAEKSEISFEAKKNCPGTVVFGRREEQQIEKYQAFYLIYL